MVAMEVYERVEDDQDVVEVIHAPLGPTSYTPHWAPLHTRPVGPHFIHAPLGQNQVTQHRGQKRSLK
jgi:hypothetical protein